MTNMSPQIGIKFNRHYWANLEKTVRDWAREPQVENLYVVTGPVYKQLNEQSVPGKIFLTYQVIGPDSVAVPTHFFKVMLAEMKNGETRTLALLLPHRGIANTEPLSDFLSSIDEIEKVSGLDFFNRLPDSLETSQERIKPQMVWTLGGP